MITETDSKAILFTDRVAILKERLPNGSLFCQVDGTTKYDWIIPIYEEMKTVT
jgi:hypothetical protein